MSGYTRINRPQLLSDSNTSTLDGSLSEIIDNPVHTDTGAYLLSRIGDIGNPNRYPVPGYCLKFDSNNPNAYIQTNIPSSEFNNYNIVIKGEGTKELLKVDTSETNIKIVLRETPTGTDYFNLSYIAFLNKETNSPQHLFECEESSGNILYDAVTGDVATIESITDINSLRISSKYKETIRNENNLQCGIKSKFSTNISIGKENEAHELTTPFNLIAPFSVCISLKFSKSKEDVYDENRVILNTANSLNILNTGSSMNRLTIGIANNSSSLYLSIDNNSYAGGGTGGQLSLTWNSEISNSLYDGNWHKLIFIIVDPNNTQTWKLVLDDKIGSYPENSDWMSIVKFGELPAIFSIIYTLNLNVSTHEGISYKNFYIFNFNMSEDSAPYTIDDYRNEVIPVNVDNTVLSLNNISKEENTWLDNSDSLTYTSIQGEYELENKNYGTWCNAVGYNTATNMISKSNWDNINLLPDTIWDCNQFQNASVSNNVLTFTKNTDTQVNINYATLSFGLNSSSTYTKFKSKKLELTGDDIYFTINSSNVIPSKLQLNIDVMLEDGTTTTVNTSSLSYSEGNFLINYDLTTLVNNATIANVIAFNLKIELNDQTTYTLNNGDSISFKNLNCKAHNFENITIPPTVINTFDTLNLPRKVLS